MKLRDEEREHASRIDICITCEISFLQSMHLNINHIFASPVQESSEKNRMKICLKHIFEMSFALREKCKNNFIYSSSSLARRTCFNMGQLT